MRQGERQLIWRWTQRYAPEVQRRLRGKLKPKGSTCHMDDTFVFGTGLIAQRAAIRCPDQDCQSTDFLGGLAAYAISKRRPTTTSRLVTEQPRLMPVCTLRDHTLHTNQENIANICSAAAHGLS